MTDVYSELVKKYGLSETQRKIIEIVGRSKIILEFGSSTGYLTREFSQNGCAVDIVEKNREAAKIATAFARDTFIGSGEDPKLLKKIVGSYDLVIFADFLEHLITPEIPVKFAKKVLKKNGRMIISIPNIASWPARKELFFAGKFEYGQTGLFDKTHLRFFSLASFKKFLQGNGIEIEKIIPTQIYLPFQRTVTKIPLIGATIFSKIYTKIANIVPNLAYYHYIVIGKIK